MNIFKRFLRRKQNIQEGFVKEMVSYYESLYSQIVENCDKNPMTYYSARGMFRHLPLRYDPNNTYPEKINQIADKCFRTLYDYCIKKSIICPDITFDEFYRGKGLYDDSYPIDKTRYRKLC